jgi:hypothetical protein
MSVRSTRPEGDPWHIGVDVRPRRAEWPRSACWSHGGCTPPQTVRPRPIRSTLSETETTSSLCVSPWGVAWTHRLASHFRRYSRQKRELNSSWEGHFIEWCFFAVFLQISERTGFRHFGGISTSSRTLPYTNSSGITLFTTITDPQVTLGNLREEKVLGQKILWRPAGRLIAKNDFPRPCPKFHPRSQKMTEADHCLSY